MIKINMLVISTRNNLQTIHPQGSKDVKPNTVWLAGGFIWERFYGSFILVRLQIVFHTQKRNQTCVWIVTPMWIVVCRADRLLPTMILIVYD